MRHFAGDKQKLDLQYILIKQFCNEQFEKEMSLKYCFELLDMFFSLHI